MIRSQRNIAFFKMLLSIGLALTLVFNLRASASTATGTDAERTNAAERLVNAQGVTVFRDDREAEVTQAFVDFNYASAVRTVLTTQYEHETFYLPFVELCHLLQIDVNVDSKGTVLRGFYAPLSTRYELDVDHLTFRCRDTTIEIDPKEILIAPSEYYLAPSLLERAFRIRLQSDVHNLFVNLDSDAPLPILAAAKREHDWRLQSEKGSGDSWRSLNNGTYYPLLQGINRSWLNGAALGYQLNANRTGTQLSSAYSVRLGAQALGGDVVLASSGTWDQRGFQIQSLNNWQWRYGFEDNHYLNSIVAGSLPVASTIQHDQCLSLRMSNEPLQPRVFFDNNIIEGAAGPNWQVELLRNGQFQEAVRADGTGHYRFTVPVYYGNMVYTVRKYSPTGSISEENISFLIPQNYYPAGSVIYALNAGVRERDRAPLADLTSTIALSDRWNVVLRSEWSKELPKSTPYIMASTALRVLQGLNVNIDAVPGGMLRAGVNTMFSNFSLFECTHTVFLDGAYRQYVGGGSASVQETKLLLQAQRVLGLEWFNLRTALSRTELQTQDMYNLTADVNSTFAGVSMMLSYRNSTMMEHGQAFSTLRYDQHLNATCSYHVFGIGGLLGWFLDNSSLSLMSSYHVERKVFENASLSLSRSIASNLVLAINGSYDPLSHHISCGLNLGLNLPTCSMQAGTQYAQNTMSSVSASMNGALAYDANSNRFSFNRMDWIGTGAAGFRPFVDANGNGKYDEGEARVDVIFTTSQGGYSDGSDPNVQRVVAVPGYARINAVVDDESISNPNYVPASKEFSFYVVPNAFNTIDVPFRVAGSIEGSIVKSSQNKSSKLGGCRLMIDGLSDTTVHTTTLSFSDGGIYIGGLLPGKYVIHPDPNQLAILHAIAQPESREIEIKATAEGELHQNVDFELVVQSKTLPPSFGPSEGVAAQFEYNLAYRIEKQQADSLRETLVRTCHLKTVVRQSAKQIYGLWTESVHNLSQADSLRDFVAQTTGILCRQLQRSDRRETQAVRYRIQLFSSAKRHDAEEYIANNSRRFAATIQLDYDFLLRRYVVLATETYQSTEAAQKRLSQSAGSFRESGQIVPESVPDSSFYVAFQSFKLFTDAQTKAQELTAKEGKVFAVEFDVETGDFILCLSSAFNSRSEALQLAATLKGNTLFQHPRIISFGQH